MLSLRVNSTKGRGIGLPPRHARGFALLLHKSLVA
jgi:hypothetical protein